MFILSTDDSLSPQDLSVINLEVLAIQGSIKVIMKMVLTIGSTAL